MITNRLNMYNWQHQDWPNFEYKPKAIDEIALKFASETGEIKGILEGLSPEFKQETILQFMISEAIKTSEIEGEYYSRQDVMSSIKKRLGVHPELKNIRDRKAQGIAELMVELREHYASPLTEELIKQWHHILFSTSRVIPGGIYRLGTEPMLIVSGSIGKETVHYEAPPSTAISPEMKQFISWYTGHTVSPDHFKEILIKTSIAHLYFESIHPFEDGNGRIGRAIAEKCLSESIGRPLILSLSTIIESDKKAYYAQLKKAQRTLEITNWIVYFSNVIVEAQKHAKKIVKFTLRKTKFIDQHKNALNERQLKVVYKMLDHGMEHFEGGMKAKKYMSIAKTSKATATRDLQDLVQKGILEPQGAGRAVSYQLKLGVRS